MTTKKLCEILNCNEIAVEPLFDKFLCRKHVCYICVLTYTENHIISRINSFYIFILCIRELRYSISKDILKVLFRISRPFYWYHKKMHYCNDANKIRASRFILSGIIYNCPNELTKLCLSGPRYKYIKSDECCKYMITRNYKNPRVPKNMICPLCAKVNICVFDGCENITARQIHEFCDDHRSYCEEHDYDQFKDGIRCVNCGQLEDI